MILTPDSWLVAPDPQVASGTDGFQLTPMQTHLRHFQCVRATNVV